MGKLLNSTEAAERLHVSRDTLYRLVSDGKLSVVKLVPGRLLFREADIEAVVSGSVVPALPSYSLTPAAGSGAAR